MTGRTKPLPPDCCTTSGFWCWLPITAMRIARVLQVAGSSEHTLVEVERELLGVDHAGIGAYLLGSVGTAAAHRRGGGLAP